MIELASLGAIPEPASERAEELFQQHRRQIFRQTDRLFAKLMLCQWIFGIIIALVASPRTWDGRASQIHIHVWAALLMGGAISLFPVWLTRVWPGAAITRHVIAVAQMLMSALLIALTGGRIETHFHVFGSLVILSFYRDWRVLVPATIVVALDHFLRGVFLPYSVYGVLSASPWRSIEHAGWVVFENVFLVISCFRSIREMRFIANRTAALEADITERTRIEAALREAKNEADRANHAKSEFLSRMSHELRTPLNAILGFGQLLERQNPTVQQRARVEHITSAGRHLLNLINEVLDISRIEAGHLQLSVEPVAVGDVLEEALALMRPLAAARDMEISVDAQLDKDLHVIADRQRLKQVLLNLLTNAVKYTAVGGGVAVVLDQSQSTNTRLVVTDTGAGIGPEKLARLFTPFDRLGAEQSGVEGTGLGLALCQRLMHAMGGDIGVLSVVGKGSAFWIELPSVDSPLKTLPKDRCSKLAEINGNSGGGRILYI